MRTVTLQSILLRAWQRAGNDGSTIDAIPSGTRVMLVAAANERIEDAWTWADWPELCAVEERTIQGDAATGYYLDYLQSGETPMGEVFAVYLDNPATHVAPREMAYTLLGDAIRFPDATSMPSTCWVRYRTRPTEYTTSDLTTAVPSVLAKAVGYGLTADILDEDGQLDKANLFEQKAENEMMNQRDKYVFQQNQPSAWTARFG